MIDYKLQYMSRRSSCSTMIFETPVLR